MPALLGIVLVLLGLGGVLWIAFQNSRLVKLVEAMKRQVDRVLDVARDAHEAARRPATRLDLAARDYIDAQRAAARVRFPLANLEPWIDGRVQWSALYSAGVRTLDDLDGVPVTRLQGIRGVGSATAHRIRVAADCAEAEIEAEPIRLPSTDLDEPSAPALVAAALDVLDTDAYLGGIPHRLAERHRALAADQLAVARRITFVGWIFKSGTAEEHADMCDARAVEYEAREYLEGEDVRAYRRASSALRMLRKENEVPATLIARFAEKSDRVLDLLRGAVGAPSAPPQKGGAPPPRPASLARPPGQPAPAPMPASPLRAVARQAIADAPLTTRGSRGRQAAWIPPGAEVEVAGFRIPGGMVYVGEDLPNPGYEYGQDPALIVPSLRVDRRNPDWAGEHMRYWPSYSEIEPASRAAYLHWLAAGRQDPSAYIGYVFLFFYGLERRMLRDAAEGNVAPDESRAILGEVDKLLSIYGGNGSFRGYASSFAEFLRLWVEPASAAGRPPPRDHRAWELPLALKRGLGAIVRDGQPIPDEWARAWILQHPDTYLRTPAQRCRKEFERLFDLTYRRRFGAGMTLRPPKRQLTATYRPASSALRESQPELTTNIPDVSALRRPVEQLREIVDECTGALDSYSRWLGRNPDGARDLSGHALLPAALVVESSDERIDVLARRLEGALGGEEHGVVSVADLFADWPAHRAGPMLKRQAVQRIRLLSALGFGIEPDVRFGGPALSSDGKAVVFLLGEEAPGAPSAEYAAAALLLHLAAVIATADGDVSAEEEEQLERHMESALGLADAERRRLRAYMRWGLLEPPGLAGLKKRIRALDERQRELVGGFLVAVACADGRTDPDEVRMLTKVYRLLELDPAHVHREIHQATTGRRRSVTEPVTVHRAAPGAGGFVISHATETQDEPDPAVELDMDLVRARMAETAAVSSLLGTIFVEEETPPPPPVPTDAAGALDAPHSGLLRALAREPTWSRDAFDELAGQFGLLPEGALDVLNEAALDAADELVCDGEDPIEVDPEIVEAVLT